MPIPDLASLPGSSRPGSGVTPSAPPLAQIDNVYSMEFDGVNDYIDVGSTTITGSCSTSLWFKTTSNALVNLLGGVKPGFPGMFQYLGIQNGKAIVFISGLAASVELAPQNINDGLWHNLVLAYDSTTSGGPAKGTFYAYVDGALTRTFDMSPFSSNWSIQTFTTIGAYSGGPFRFFNGFMDEVAVWDVTLTEAEALSIYNATEAGKTADLSQLTTPPIAWYRMGD